jgi:hypothetical protein
MLSVFIWYSLAFLSAGQQTPNAITGQTSWPAVSDPNELNIVNSAGEYVVALMNLRGIFSNPTMYDRTIVAYRCARELDTNTRYFLVMDVNEGDGSFVIMVETYQDHLKNWQPIIPTPTKNFKKTSEQTPVDVNFDLWFASSSANSAVSSALKAAKEHLETVYYPISRNQTFRLEQLLHAELLEPSTENFILRRQNEVKQMTDVVAKSRETVHALARNLSRNLAVRKSRLLVRESMRKNLSNMISSNSTEEESFESSVEVWFRSEIEHNVEMERLSQVWSCLVHVHAEFFDILLPAFSGTRRSSQRSYA